MTVHKFIELETEEQVEMISYGQYCGTREEGACVVVLYKIRSLFVEVFYLRNNIVKIRPFHTRLLLERYYNENLN